MSYNAKRKILVDGLVRGTERKLSSSLMSNCLIRIPHIFEKENLIMEPVKKRKGYPTNPQKTRLISLLQADDELRGGKFSASFTKKISEARWVAIAVELNSIPGAKKTWAEWRRTWQDMKTKTKKKETAVRRSFYTTGGGPPPDNLSGDDILILDTISQAEREGHADCQESFVYFKDLPSYSVVCTPEIKTNSPSCSVVCTSENKTNPPSCSVVCTSENKTNSPSCSVVCTSENKTNPPSCSVVCTSENKTNPPSCSVVCIPEIETNPNEESQEQFLPAATSLNKENIDKKKRYKKPVAKKRLDKSLETATALKQTLEEKNVYKKLFYENYIKEMRRQTDALLLIANNMKSKND